jgi:hypothetical protein
MYVFALSIEVWIGFCPVVMIGCVADHDGISFRADEIRIDPVSNLSGNPGMELGCQFETFCFGGSDTVDEILKAQTASYVSADQGGRDLVIMSAYGPLAALDRVAVMLRVFVARER